MKIKKAPKLIRAFEGIAVMTCEKKLNIIRSTPTTGNHNPMVSRLDIHLFHNGCKDHHV